MPRRFENRLDQTGREKSTSWIVGVAQPYDAYGRILPGARLGLGAIGIVDAPLPSALQPTPYYRYGDRFFAVLVILSGLVGAAYRVQLPTQFDGRAS